MNDCGCCNTTCVLRVGTCCPAPPYFCTVVCRTLSTAEGAQCRTLIFVRSKSTSAILLQLCGVFAWIKSHEAHMSRPVAMRWDGGLCDHHAHSVSSTALTCLCSSFGFWSPPTAWLSRAPSSHAKSLWCCQRDLSLMHEEDLIPCIF